MADVILLQSNVADGASAEGFRLRTGNTLSTGGAVVAVIENNGTDVLTLDKDGNLTVAGTISGTGGFGSGDFADDVFRIQDNGDASKELAFEVSAITTATTRTLTMPDVDIDLNLILSHASRHITGGADEIDGDQLDIDFTPSNYVPDVTPSEASNVDHLTAHLAGIDNILAAIGSGDELTSTTSVNVFIDNDDNGTGEEFTIYHDKATAGAGDELFVVRENGEVEIFGDLIGGSSPFVVRSKEANGATAAGFRFNTDNALTTNGSTVWELQNNSIDFANFRRGNDGLGGAFISDQNFLEIFDKAGANPFCLAVTDDPSVLGITTGGTPIDLVSVGASVQVLSSMDLNQTANSALMTVQSLAGSHTMNSGNQAINGTTGAVADIISSLTAGAQPTARLRADNGAGTVNANVRANLEAAGRPESFLQSVNASGNVKVEASEDATGLLIQLQLVDSQTDRILMRAGSMDFQIDGNQKLLVDTDGITVTGEADLSGADLALQRVATAISLQTSGQTLIGVTDTSAARTITLATADTIEGRIIIVKDESGNASTGGNPITIDTQGSELIDGAASVQITADYGVIRLYSDGTNWFSI